MPSIVMIVVIAPTPQAECTMIQCVMVDIGIVAMNKMYAVVRSIV